MTIGAWARRLWAWCRPALRRSGALAPLTWKNRAFDAAVTGSLLLAALWAGEGDVDYPSSGPEPVLSPAPVPGTGPVQVPALDPLFGDEVRVRLDRGDPFLPIEHDQAGWSIVMVLVVLPLLFRRRYPLAMLWAVIGMASLSEDYHAALRLCFYACVIAAYTAAVYSPYRIPALFSLPIAAAAFARLGEPALPTVPDGAVPFLILIPIAVAADGLRRWRSRADEGRERLATLERDQAEALRRAAEHERARIARELHDVVTHNVSVMVIQAGAARKVMDAEPGQAREALLAVEAGGRAAMTELRHVMGLLTMDSDGPDPAAAATLAPQPGIDRLDALVHRVRAIGTPVEFTVDGAARPLPTGVELTAYRVVQEALTNTVKHAAGATATVRVDYGSDRLRVEVADTGGAPGASAGSGAGHGLIGLRERIAVYGGTLLAGPRVSGGYRVVALIPLEAP